MILESVVRAVVVWLFRACTGFRLPNRAIATAAIASTLATASPAALVSYDLTFSGGSGGPTQGAFSFDTSRQQFTDFNIEWHGKTFDILNSANGPVTQNYHPYGSCTPFNAQAVYSAITGGGRCAGDPLTLSWNIYPPNPAGNTTTSQLSLTGMTSGRSGFVIGASYPDRSYIAAASSGAFTTKGSAPSPTLSELLKTTYTRTTCTGGLCIDPNGPTMGASFVPNLGYSLEEVAAVGGFDHFNWVQHALEYPGVILNANYFPVTAPFLDPVHGGWATNAADQYDFYLDEAPVAGGSNWYLEDWTTDHWLGYSDTPYDKWIKILGGRMKFMTSLVGVHEDKSYETLRTFAWTSDNATVVSLGVGGYVGARNQLTAEDIAYYIREGLFQDTIDNIEVISPYDLPEAVQSMMLTAGWKGQHQDVPIFLSLAPEQVPEPSSLALVVAALVGVCFSRQRHLVQTLTRPNSLAPSQGLIVSWRRNGPSGRSLFSRRNA